MRQVVAWPVCALVALCVGGATLAVAWLCDDALVTLRNVENIVAGDGFRWNVLDRVQTAMHPLWILLLAAFRAVTGEAYFTTLGVGVGLTTICAFVLARHACSGSAALAIVGVGALGSRAFVEFGTGGLENPLVYALLAWFVREWVISDGARRLGRLVLVSALLGLARQDVALLIAPSVVLAMRGLSVRQILAGLWPGVSIVLAWCAFALVYFGTIVPAPAYGKVIAADVESSALMLQGLRYFGDVAMRDPVTILVLVMAIVAGVIRPSVERTALAVGIVLQVGYVVSVGGDFMSGRFFTAAFVVALFVSGRALRGAPAVFLGAVLVGATFVPGLPPWACETPQRSEAAIRHGIGNERAYYAETLGLWSASRVTPKHGMVGQLFEGRDRPTVLLATTAGAGFVVGRDAHVVEPFLCDPLLMRLPLADPGDWRIGHFRRRVPEGYLETLASGENRIHHPALAEYWDALEPVLRAPLFSAERWSALAGFWTGEHDALLQRYVEEGYLPAPLVERDWDELRGGASPGTSWQDARCVVVREGGLRLRRDRATPARAVRLLVDGGGRGELVFRRGDRALGSAPLDVPEHFPGGGRWVTFAVPDSAREFDAVDVVLRAADPDLDSNVYTLPVFAVLAVGLD